MSAEKLGYEGSWGADGAQYWSESIFDIKFDNFLHFYPSIITIVRAVESEAGGHCRTGVTGWENIWL